MENKTAAKLSIEQLENLNQAIRLTQKLRSSVSRVFHDLSDGTDNTKGNEKTFLSDIQKSIVSVTNDFSELEKVANNLNPILQTPNSANVCLDPAIDKLPVYSQLLQAYKWTNKTAEHAGAAAGILQMNTLKRSPLPGVSSGIKGIKRSRALPMPYNVPASVVDNLIAGLDRQFPEMGIAVTRPLGSCAIVQLTLERTLRALIVLRGCVIEWVKIKGYHENFLADDGKIDIWSASRYQVFQKITDHASAASLHFYHPTYTELTVKSLVLWLRAYNTLFSAPCNKCGKHLQGALPPTWRDFRTLVPYHEGCKQ
ncbi:mediator of RNA polymerase II transcription subunit 27-like [Haliotis cracherodii]|uniref:mediator of RNA polymerase II transcription subunit 27-like n=1 Tax=Haliotis cracherodii TaxID=6455 RepID=UPI0039E73705